MDDRGGTILLVDDEDSLRQVLRARLALHGYRVREAVDGAEALRAARSLQPDLILVDLGLPDVDGMEVTLRIREFSPVPIIVLSVRRADSDKIAALEAGADDYLTKPCNLGELLDRIRSAMRMTLAASKGVFAAGDLVVDLDGGSVCLDSRPVKLTDPEFDVLRALISNAGRLLTQRRLAREVWGEGTEENALRMLRSTMITLRRKLDANPARPGHISTEPGVGYRLRIPSGLAGG